MHNTSHRTIAFNDDKKEKRKLVIQFPYSFFLLSIIANIALFAPFFRFLKNVIGFVFFLVGVECR